MFYICADNTVATGHLGAIGHLKCGYVTEKLNFQFYLIFINLKLNRYTWLIATVLDNVALDVCEDENK